MINTMYAKKMKTLLKPSERKVLSKLNSARKIQDFLDTLPINFEESGETLWSPCKVLQHKKAHCMEAAIFAAATLAYHGRPPLLVDFQAIPSDEDHVIAVFKEKGLWGAISKTNHVIIRWRDPMYRSIRELAMSYFHEYFLRNGKKSLRAYSRPFDLRKYPLKKWLIAEENLDWLAEDLDDSPHSSILPKKSIQLRDITPFELKMMKFSEWLPQKKIKRKYKKAF